MKRITTEVSCEEHGKFGSVVTEVSDTTESLAINLKMLEILADFHLRKYHAGVLTRDERDEAIAKCQ